MKKVLIFDCDGVLADTERYAHLPAFNQMWRECGVPWQWSVDQYGEKLKIGGGKERMLSLFRDTDFLRAWEAAPSDPALQQELILTWHKRKSALYKEIISSGKIPPRPGIKRLSEEALANGWLLAVASTSALESVEAVLRHVVGDLVFRQFSLILAGDCVKAKKPAPDIYLLAAEKMDVSPKNIVVVEDSANGLEAASAAGMKVVITVSSYTSEEDFSKAPVVLNCLGDPDGEKLRIISNRCQIRLQEWFTAQNLEEILSS